MAGKSVHASRGSAQVATALSLQSHLAQAVSLVSQRGSSQRECEIHLLHRGAKLLNVYRLGQHIRQVDRGMLLLDLDLTRRDLLLGPKKHSADVLHLSQTSAGADGGPGRGVVYVTTGSLIPTWRATDCSPIASLMPVTGP